MKHVGVRTNVADIASQDQIQAINANIKNLNRAASCNIGGVISGVYYDNSFGGLTAGTTSIPANTIAAVPFVSSVDMVVDRIGVPVTTLATAGTADLHIYENLSTGWPGAKLLSSSVLNTSTTGFKVATISFTFEAGKVYWLAIRASVAVTVRGVQLANAKQFGIASADGSGSTYATALAQTSSMAGEAPANWGTVDFSQFNASSPPSIRFRAV